MSKAEAKKELWKCDWSKAPEGTIGACYNADGIAWFWSVEPKIKGNEKHPNFLRWRGPDYGRGYTMIGSVVSEAFAASTWKDSWMLKP